MKKIAALLVSFLVLAAVFGSGGCSGADEISGPPELGTTPRPTASPDEGTGNRRPTPNPCRHNPADC